MSDYIIYNGELYHHGVKGMKWGVRKARNQRHKHSSTVDPMSKDDKKAKTKKAVRVGATATAALLAGSFAYMTAQRALWDSGERTKYVVSLAASALASMGTTYVVGDALLREHK